MLQDLKVKAGPEFYKYSQGAIDEFVPQILDEYRAKRILLVHGSISWEKAKPFMSFLSDEKYEFIYHQYTGECSYYGTNLIVKQIEENGIDFIIGVGGGKLADLVEYSAHLANVACGVIPTLSSNCAPWTPLSVMYKESGESEGRTEHYLRQAAFFITDPSLVIDSPVRYFIAGLADTIAKWYESDLILKQDSLKALPFLQTAQYTSALCKEAILTHSEQAIMDMRDGKVSDEFVNLSEIVFAVAGLVGGLGDKYARNAAAHAMHDAISKYLPASHNYLHGEKVAYGILYQLTLEKRWALIDELLPFYASLELPRTLSDMQLMPVSDDTINKITSFINSKEKVHLIPIEINNEKLQKAIFDLEEYIKHDSKEE
ncbi:MAG: iron-containing alcohol dehydrogenase family protein [Tetragenococcus koreensis]|nr:iron-containing alcohol dehydrogenase family protein [Staphylococcus equorum]MDN6730787.1 iron-containing alcohol dehydrogenase family protein [Atopostipes suicloacalis]MDN6733644.1 iron-containing alcohol dehydrogenase family protein [Tetragenococcus koreensis]